MENQDIAHYSKPSKRFLIRGGIASLLIILILTVQTQWFSNLFSKNKGASVSVNNATVGEVVGKDSNGNGIADWEERLWGLDPNVTTTNGVSNKTIIEQKRKQVSNYGSQNDTLNETDMIARELFTLSTAIGQEGGDAGSIAEKISEKNFQKDITPVYTIKNIQTTKTTNTSLVTYKNEISEVLQKNKEASYEIDIFTKGLETGDFSDFSKLQEIAISYKNLSKKLLLVRVPVGVASYHLQIVNSINGYSRAIEKMMLLEENSIIALVGFAEYRDFDRQMDIASANLISYFELYGII